MNTTETDQKPKPRNFKTVIEQLIEAAGEEKAKEMGLPKWIETYHFTAPELHLELFHRFYFDFNEMLGNGSMNPNWYPSPENKLAIKLLSIWSTIPEEIILAKIQEKINGK